MKKNCLGQAVSYSIGTPFQPTLPLAPKLFQAQLHTVLLPVGHLTLAAHLEYLLVSHLREYLPWVNPGQEVRYEGTKIPSAVS